MKTRNNDQAMTRFMINNIEALESAKRLVEFLENHGDVSPDEINWCDVGDMSSINTDLKEITDRVFSEGEYA